MSQTCRCHARTPMAEDWTDGRTLTGAREEHAGQATDAASGSAGEPSPEETALLDEIRERFAFVCTVEHDQRQQEDDDLRFEGGDQWLPEHLDARAEHRDESTGRAVPARPALSINLVEQPVQRVLSEARQARLAISVQPKAGLANSEQAGYYRGLIRSIQAESGAMSVRLWALERTAICGRGAYLIDTEYANDGDFDLDIVYRRILDQGTVYWDPYAQLSDCRDADWVLITDWMSEAERLRRWPDKPLRPTQGAFEKADDPWFAIDDKANRRVRVGTYYKVIYQRHRLVYHPQMGAMPEREIPEGAKPRLLDGELRARIVEARRVHRYIVDGSQILEQTPWDGRYLPVVPVSGKEYVIKGARSWKGIVTNAKDLNRGYNVAISSAVEAAGSMPRSPYVMYAGQDENFEEMWDDSPIKAYTRLYVNLLEVGGKPVPLPQRQNNEPALQGTLLLARALKDDIASVTGHVDLAQRVVNPYDRSGKAIDLLQRQGAAGTSNFLDNLATISMMQEGRILIDLIPKVYDRPGRILAVMDEEQEDETTIMLKTPFVRNEDGQPTPVPCPMCEGRGIMRPPRSARAWFPTTQRCPGCEGRGQATRETMPKEQQGQKVRYVDLSEGQFKVTVSIGRGALTQQEEAMSAMTQLASSAPALVPVYADLWVRSMGFPGSTEIANRLKRVNPQASEEDDGQSVPPEFAAKYQQLVAQHALAMQELQKATEALETDAVKAASAEKLLAMKLEAGAGLEHLKQQGHLMEQTREAQTDRALTLIKGELEAMRQQSEQRHEVLLELLQYRHSLAAAEQQERARESRPEPDAVA